MLLEQETVTGAEAANLDLNGLREIFDFSIRDLAINFWSVGDLDVFEGIGKL